MNTEENGNGSANDLQTVLQTLENVAQIAQSLAPAQPEAPKAATPEPARPSAVVPFVRPEPMAPASIAGAGERAPARRASSLPWESIEAEYRAGILSVRRIAEAAGCDESTIRTKAKASGWKRDLAPAIADETARQLAESAAGSMPAGHPASASPQAMPADSAQQYPQDSRKAPLGRSALSDDEITTRAAQAAASVVLQHRQGAQTAQQAVQSLIRKLALMAQNADTMLELLLTFVDTEKEDGRMNPMQAAETKRALAAILSLPGMSKAARELTAAFKTMVEIEREAYGVDSVPQSKADDSYEGRLARLDAEGRIEPPKAGRA